MAMYLFRDWADNMRPTRLLDQHFGLGLLPDDLLTPLTRSSISPMLHGSYYRPWRVNNVDTGSTVQCTKDKFQVNLDVQQFTPEEVKVKVVDDSIVIEGKHEEKQDDHGYISRQFVRRYVLPKGYDAQNIASSLSSDGVLSITAPKSGSPDTQERVIPITHTGPAKAIKGDEKKATEEKK